jgi:hypothetical protein
MHYSIFKKSNVFFCLNISVTNMSKFHLKIHTCIVSFTSKYLRLMFSLVGVAHVWCGVAQLVARRLAVGLGISDKKIIPPKTELTE